MSLTPAMANAEPNGPFGNAFERCALDAFNLYINDKISWELYLQEKSDCCTILGGTYNDQKDECYFDDEPTVNDTKPRPGATVLRHPGENQVL